MVLATQTLQTPQNKGAEPPTQLYRHSRRPEWGLALLVWEKQGRRAYQFEDGNLRKIREGYYTLLDPVDSESHDGPTEAVRSNLQAAVKARRGGTAKKIQKPVCAFEEQIALFTRLYPKGFQDPEWISDHRGEEGGSDLKRHREPSIAAIREALDPSLCQSLIEEGRHAEITESVLDVLAGTDLVPISHVKTMRRLDEEESARYAEVVVELIHGEDPFDNRFRGYLQMLEQFLGGRPSWRIATALLALSNPHEHVAVRRSAFLRQAGSIAPTGNYTRKPKVSSYKSFRRVAVGVKKRLEGAGHEPRDLLDVHDFIWATLRKSALDHLGGDD